MNKPDPTVVVQIKYDGVDITADCVLADTWFTARANGVAGEAQVVIRDDAQIKTFIPGKVLELYVDGRREWDGYAVQRKHNYWFEGHTANCYPCPHITPRKHILIGADRNLLFERRVLYNKADPDSATDNIWPAGSLDEEVIEDSINLYLDDVDGIDYTTKVEQVAEVDPWAEIRVPGPSSVFGDLMREVAQATGAVFYIDPDRYLVYTDVNNPDAPFVLTDQPLVEGEVGYREMTIIADASNMVNDALIWGAGQGSPNIVFARVTDTFPDYWQDEERLSVEIHGRWQNPNGYRLQVWNQGSVERIANSIVYGSPSNKRGHKDDQVTVELTTYTPGLRVAQKVDFRNETHDFADVIPIRNIRMSFPQNNVIKYEVRLSHDLDEPWSIVEPWFPTSEDPTTYPPNSCTVYQQFPPSGIVLAPGETQSGPFMGTTYAKKGYLDVKFAIEEGVNVKYYLGDNEYEYRGGDNGDPFVEVNYIFEDKLWYTLSRAGLLEGGGRIWDWENRYEGYLAPYNTENSEWPVRATIQVELTMSGTESTREWSGGGVLGPGHTYSEPIQTEQHVLFGLYWPSTQRREAHSHPSVVLWEGMMKAGDVVNFTLQRTMEGHTYWMLGVDFEDLTVGGYPWLTGLEVRSVISLSYENARPLSHGLLMVGPDEDGLPCVEIGDLGHHCMTAVHLYGNTYRVQPYAVRTSRVTVNGLTLSGGGIQYVESSPERGEIELLEPPDGDVYVCYDVALYATGLPPTGELFVLPVNAPLSGTFGAQTGNWPSASWHGTYYEHFHNGVDFAVGVGTPVYAAANGTVRYEDQAAGGTMIHIYHEVYGFRTTYAHLSSRVVPDGSTVLQGQLIAFSGDSGTVTGPHLHWGLVYAGSPEDPLAYSNYTPQVQF